MQESEERLKLSDLMDIKLFQDLQDDFAKTMNVAILTFDENGPITNPSNSTDFCINYIRANDLGSQKCNDCYCEGIKSAAESGKPYIYSCHAGLTCFVVPIVFEGTHVASIIGGQIVSEQIDEEHFKNIAKELGINNEAEYLVALRKLKIIPKENIEAAANLLFLIVNNLFKITHKNHELIELNKREKLIRTVIEAIRNSLDIDITKKQIIDIVGQTLGADRCFIMEYNKEMDRFMIIQEEYLASDKIFGYIGQDVNKDVPNFMKDFKSGKILKISNEEIYIDDERQYYPEELEIIEKYKIYSAYGFPLFYNNELLGVLVLHYLDARHKISDEELNFLKIIAHQMEIAYHQAKLYERIQLQAEREKINRKLIEILRSTLDKKTIKHLFVKNIGKYFNADRVFFAEFDHRQSKYLSVEQDSEYLSTPEQKSFVGLELSGEMMGAHIQPLVDKRELIIKVWNDYVRHSNKPYEFVRLYEEAGVKSSYSFPVMYEGRRLGYFCIEFTKNIKELFDEDINRIRDICTQAGIALHHAELYLEAQEALRSKNEFITKIKSFMQGPLDNILKISKELSDSQVEHDKQLEYLNNIINSCNQLIELTSDISG